MYSEEACCVCHEEALYVCHHSVSKVKCIERKGALLYDEMVCKEDVCKHGWYVYELVRKNARYVIEERVLCMSRNRPRMD